MYGSKVDQDGDLWDQMRELDVSWIPESLKLRRSADETLEGGAKTTLNKDEEQVEYELSAISQAVPFIDDHISCEEEISDYVSKYSGIFPGDLDPIHSSHHLTSLKRTYKKVRHLVDVGCIFVRHGLKNDFDMLGIVVPSDQVVDTVHLFHLPHWRLLSLKFLAWYFLDKHIQKECHNSNEDAGAALELYQIYLDLEAQGTVKATLAKVLDQVRLLNRKVPQP
ncbi:hypothetical protein TCAL_12334 [Tigriopus californicus]|uniref:Exonuclease domain-containing protein n=1 Tax=Tigriopus californicus TaxID=6832 RepID=A0A553PU01_TIGCA|nr:hypothetical protein TCAL_12334 [Tigriopus californicus]|eukprot:TCALIF_12334-PA protein Name:"Similar to PAN2 PAB-dependent poly(A)-specific ribonuclease subunit PAN2 (Homo sapiens)" AED:0.21 eAED:0.27 QI:0/0/0/0.33/1/1/3/0/222